MYFRSHIRSRFVTGAFFASTLVFAASAVQAERTQFQEKHVPEAVASGQVSLVSRVAPSQKFELAIALPLRHEAELNQLLKDLYDPSSPRFHHYLTVEQFADRFAPTKEEYAQVVKYARDNGFNVTVEHANRLAVSFTGTSEQVEHAFNVQMNTYAHPTEYRNFYAPDREPTIEGLSVPVLRIAGLENFVLPHPRLKRNPLPPSGPTAQAAAKATTTCSYNVNVGTGPCGTYSPTNDRTAYYGTGSLNGSGQQIGILGFGGACTSDVSLMATQEGIATPTVVYKLGSAATRCGSDGEQVLDIIYSFGMAPGVTEINFFSNASNDLTIINAEASNTASSVYSSSWGWGFSNHTAEDNDFKEMQAQGQSFVNATGDDGAYNSSTWDFPSGDPYITEVGGSSLVTASRGGAWKSESGWTYSGGGYPPKADAYAIPTWQTAAINSNNKGSTTYRNDPDVAAEADFDNLSCSNGKCVDGYGGTSYAAPQWAGYIAMINQQMKADGNGSIGFLNTHLYAVGESATYKGDFHDITSGSNPSSGGTPKYTFNAVTGYDDVTGWGSPNGAGLINTLASKEE